MLTPLHLTEGQLLMAILRWHAEKRRVHSPAKFSMIARIILALEAL
jgi:hypothetical protein